MKLSGEARAAYGILAVIVAVPVVAVVTFVAMVLWPRDFDRVTAESISPDGRAIVRVVHRDTGMGYGSGEEWGEIVLERPGRWFGAERKTLWQFGLDGRPDTRARIEWRDPSHAVVTFAAETTVATTSVSALGITTEIVPERPPRPGAAPAAP